MNYDRKVVEQYALYSYVIVNILGEEYKGWLVRSQYFAGTYSILQDGGKMLDFKLSHINSITLVNNGYTLPKKIKEEYK